MPKNSSVSTAAWPVEYVPRARVLEQGAGGGGARQETIAPSRLPSVMASTRGYSVKGMRGVQGFWGEGVRRGQKGWCEGGA